MVIGPVAQWIRHRPTEPGLAGSSPAGVIWRSGRCYWLDESIGLRAFRTTQCLEFFCGFTRNTIHISPPFKVMHRNLHQLVAYMCLFRLLVKAMELAKLIYSMAKASIDTLPEWPQGVDSSSTSASCVGSNPTGVISTTK